MLDGAKERTKLFILLALNCGFYSVDIARLTRSEFHEKEGRIIRQRSKTRGKSDRIPKVNYKLWTPTIRLLTKYAQMSNHPTLLLTNVDGGQLWSEYEKGGTIKHNDNVKNAYFRLQAELKIPKRHRKPFKTFRKTSSSRLDEHTEYGRYAEYFLGEAPRSIAGKHYVKPSRDQFDNALIWLGKEYGIQ